MRAALPTFRWTNNTHGEERRTVCLSLWNRRVEHPEGRSVLMMTIRSPASPAVRSKLTRTRMTKVGSSRRRSARTACDGHSSPKRHAASGGRREEEQTSGLSSHREALPQHCGSGRSTKPESCSASRSTRKERSRYSAASQTPERLEWSNSRTKLLKVQQR